MVILLTCTIPEVPDDVTGTFTCDQPNEVPSSSGDTVTCTIPGTDQSRTLSCDGVGGNPSVADNTLTCTLPGTPD